MVRPFRILLVDDENIQRDTLADILRKHFFQVVTAKDGLQAQKQLTEIEFDILLTDFKMPGLSGLDLARFSLSRSPKTSIILMTAFADVESVIESMRLGVVDYLLKPVNVDLLVRKMDVLREQKDLRNEIINLRAALHQRQPLLRLAGESAVMSEIRSRIQQIAPNRSTVLISGESGTGKEVAAREIMEQSGEHSKKFIAVNCGAITESLLESELFGHKKGSFTGAISDRDGHFVAAQGGTIFLDEIGELPKSLQVKLLRVLQEKEVTPVGSSEPIKIDVRVIAATNRDLEVEVKEGRFRQDLYYRLNVMEIKMPPLRDRVEDIPGLGQSILQRLNIELRKTIKGITMAAQSLLMGYRWPGNVRELENIIERSMILAGDSEYLEAHHLPASFQNLGGQFGSVSEDLESVLQAHARLHIVRILEKSGGDKKEAAKVLGLGLSSLYRKLEELGIGTAKGTDPT